MYLIFLFYISLGLESRPTSNIYVEENEALNPMSILQNHEYSFYLKSSTTQKIDLLPKNCEDLNECRVLTSLLSIFRNFQ
jgi:hypothetical protein